MPKGVTVPASTRLPWNRGRIISPKPPLKPKHIWALRTHLQLANCTRDLAVDSKLRGCDLVALRVSDIHLGDAVRLQATVCQRKTGRPVPFEITEPTREALAAWLTSRRLKAGDWLFPRRPTFEKETDREEKSSGLPAGVEIPQAFRSLGAPTLA